MGNVTIFDHPLIHHKLSIIRNEETKTRDFRESVSEIASLMAYEITRELSLKEIETQTPLTKAMTYTLADEVVIIPILRAGLGMVEGIHSLIPAAKVGHIGLYRDEKTLRPELYYDKFPPTLKEAYVLLVDPMLATGGSAVRAIDILKERGATNISYVGIVGVKDGIDNIQQHHPEVSIFLAAQDDHLNEHGYIVPGLGDCGDRLFGTK